MSDPRELSELIFKNLLSGETFEDQADGFDYEMAVRLAADTLRMALNTNDKKTVLMQVGALGALGIEIEDLKFLKHSDINKIVSFMM